jgi:15-cis-phytoene synthase
MTGRLELQQTARDSLTALYSQLRDAGCAAPLEAEGQMIRPLLALAGADALGCQRDASFWAAVAAVQLAHEASLVHDDVIDRAQTRRSAPTIAASRGVAAALVEGDHLLTTAYRLAATTTSGTFMTSFTHAVERTVAGEKLQGRSAGEQLDERAYRHVVGMKSGELLGCALATAPLLAADPRASDWYVLGRRIGTLYQMLDDLLDYCPAVDLGKPTLGDFVQGRWTWPLLEFPDVAAGDDVHAVALRFATPDASGMSPLQRCGVRFRREVENVRAAVASRMPYDVVINEMLQSWVHRVEAAVAAHAEVGALRVRESLDARVLAVGDLRTFFRENSRSFAFAAALFPAEFRTRVSGVYAFCRLTDDLADSDDGLGESERLLRLDLWERLARSAYTGEASGIPLLDDVMTAAAGAGVPFAYVEELMEGMRMDLRGERYETLADLRRYSYRVAGVVGQWLTRMCGVHDSATLERAAHLGHAMQLTNILRDVGEDLRAGRLYLPAETLRTFGITEAQLLHAMQERTVPARYPEMLEQLMHAADADYASTLGAVGALPAAFRRAIVVAAHVYRGIHAGIRTNAYDNLNARARVGLGAKVLLALRAVMGQGIAPLPHNARPPAAEMMVAATAPPSAPAPPHRRVSAALLLLGTLAAAAPAEAQRGSAAPSGDRPARETMAPASPASWAHFLESAHAAAPHDAAIGLDLLRSLFFVSVDSAAALPRAQETLERVRAHAPGFARERRSLLLAYEGALLLLHAKHGSWPPARLRAVRGGLDRLDAAVAAAPGDVEIRYLRLVNTHYMPRFLGRRESAREDLRAVAALLPDASLPTVLHSVISEFVKNNAE